MLTFGIELGDDQIGAYGSQCSSTEIDGAVGHAGKHNLPQGIRGHVKIVRLRRDRIEEALAKKMIAGGIVFDDTGIDGMD
jgi:hypothetical protein